MKTLAFASDLCGRFFSNDAEVKQVKWILGRPFTGIKNFYRHDVSLL
jgi:hypothetical protein